MLVVWRETTLRSSQKLLSQIHLRKNYMDMCPLTVSPVILISVPIWYKTVKTNAVFSVSKIIFSITWPCDWYWVSSITVVLSILALSKSTKRCFRIPEEGLVLSGCSEGTRIFVCSCIQLCSPMDCSPPGSSVHGICEVGCSYLPGDLPDPGTEPHLLVSCIGRHILNVWNTWEACASIFILKEIPQDI